MNPAWNLCGINSYFNSLSYLRKKRKKNAILRPPSLLYYFFLIMTPWRIYLRVRERWTNSGAIMQEIWSNELKGTETP